MTVVVPRTVLRLGALGGGGRIFDDFNGDGGTDLRYSGWAASAVWDVFPALRRAGGWSLPESHALEVAGRFERFDQEVDESGVRARRERTTVGVNYVASTSLKLQLNYVLRRGDDPAAAAPNLANDAFLASFQAAF